MLHYLNLDERVRRLMLDEVERDIERGTLFVSPRLTNTGVQNYATLLKEAIRDRTDAWLAEQLRGRGRLRTTEQRRKPKGGYSVAKVPAGAATTIAEGDFNQYYVRALCRAALEVGVPELVIYRAKRVARPRPESQQLLGRRISAAALLEDLRSHTGMEPALGLPPGPNSGLSVRLPDDSDERSEPDVDDATDYAAAKPGRLRHTSP
jgi:hypothetical protein